LENGLHLYVLGPPLLQIQQRPLTADIISSKGQALLIYLAVSGRSHARMALAGLLWGDMPEEAARANLRLTLSKLRKAVPETILSVTRSEIGLADFWLDADTFTERLESGDWRLKESFLSQSQAADLQSYLDLYRGDFLDAFQLATASDFEVWSQAQRARLRQTAVTGLSKWLATAVQQYDYESGLIIGHKLLSIEPWHEEGQRQLMRVLALSGQRSAALAQYETCCRLLENELGIAPAAATVELVEQIKAGELSGGVDSPLLPRSPAPLHNLPPQITPFVGREAELVQLQMLLAQPDVHLITILGAGGMGKTRLALALAERELFKEAGDKTHPYLNGVYFVSLARLETADSLLPAIAEAINLRFSDGQDQREQLLRYMSKKAMLLVLDNFEHLLTPSLIPPNGGDKGGVTLVDEILQRAPQVKLLITSRARLKRQSEQLFPVAGMAYPALNGANGDNLLDLNQYSAIQLFVQCARRLRPDFEITAVNQADVLQICHLLQGMPLGIVLAASWLESLSTRAVSREMQQDLDFLATDMGDVPRRQRSLRAAFNHSWRLLSQPEQAIFCQMSIFRGGFTRAAAQAVTGATLRDLQALVNKSLLTLAKIVTEDLRYIHQQNNRPIRVYNQVDVRFTLEDFFSKLKLNYS
jgi:predicted ATPase/DNA-binding SARP family transcriptional activator